MLLPCTNDSLFPSVSSIEGPRQEVSTMQDSETSWMEQPLSPPPHTHTWWLFQDNSLSTRTMKLNRPSTGCTLAAGACEDSSAALTKTTHPHHRRPGTAPKPELQNRSSQGIKRRLATKTPLSLGTGQGLIRCPGGSWLLGASSAVAGTDEDRSSEASLGYTKLP